MAEAARQHLDLDFMLAGLCELEFLDFHRHFIVPENRRSNFHDATFSNRFSRL
jgi:hypothetical protein